MLDNNDDTTDGRPKKKRGLFGALLARQAAPPAARTTGAQRPSSPTDPIDDAQEAQTVTHDTDSAGQAPSTPADDSAAPAQATPDAGRAAASDVAPAVDVEAVEADIADGEPAAEAPATGSEPAADPSASPIPAHLTTTSLIFHAPVITPLPARPGRRRDDRDDHRDQRDDLDERDDEGYDDGGWDDEPQRPASRRRSRGRSQDREERDSEARQGDRGPRERPQRQVELITEPQRIKGSTRLEAKKQRRRDGRDAGRRRTVITEAEFLARRESVDRKMVVRSSGDRIEIGVMEDGTLAEHYVAKAQNVSLIGNVYLGRVQNVLPSMEAAFVDIGRGRNAVLYSGEVDWDSLSNGNQPRRIELALKPGDRVLVQVTKDPVGHKGARLTSQISLPGRYLVYVPNGSMNGISRKLPDTERARLKKILKEALPENAGVIVRTAAEGATEEQLTLDIKRLTNQWADISSKVEAGNAPAQLHSEPDLLIKIVRDVFNEDFHELVIDGDDAYGTLQSYLSAVAPDLKDRVEIYDGPDSFEEYRLNEQIEKALDRKVWLPSGGSLVIDRTEAMTVVDVNTGKFVGSGGNLEETVTKNNLEAAEELVRQLRLRDIGGIIVVDFIDMVLESNRDLVLRRLVECLSRDRTKHQVAEVTSLGLVQMTRKKIGVGLRESLDEVNAQVNDNNADPGPTKGRRKARSTGGNGSGNGSNGGSSNGSSNGSGSNGGGAAHQITEDVKNALSRIAASTLPHEESGAPRTGIANPRGGAAAPAAETPASPASTATPVSAPDEADQSQGQAHGGEQPSGKRRRRRGGRGGNGAGGTVGAEQTPAPEERPAATSGRSESTPAARAAEQAPAPVTSASAPTAAEPVKAPARRRASSSATVTPADTTVAILDIPVAVTKREPRPVTGDAESLLDSVLQALPEPKQPGQGRSRSRRVSSPSISAPATADTATDAGDTPDAGAVIVGN